MTEALVQSWLDDYIEAWRSYDAGAIGALFTEDAAYRCHPGDPPVEGREAIVAMWRRDPDAPGSWSAVYAPWLVSGDRAVAVGRTSYESGKEYFNLFQLAFREGRCFDFVEWFMVPREAD